MHNGSKDREKIPAAVEGVQVIDAPEQTDQPFTIEKALNTPGFAEFLAEDKDAENFDMGDTEKIATLHKAFEAIGPTNKGIQEFLNSNDSFQSLGIDFEKGGFPQKIAEHLGSMARENPQSLVELNAVVEEYHAIKNAIGHSESMIADDDGSVASVAELQNALNQLRGKEATLNKAKEVSGFFARRFTGIAAAYEKFLFEHTVEHAEEWLATHKTGDPIPGKYTRAKMEEFVQERSEARKSHNALLTVRDEYMIDVNPEAIAEALSETAAEIRETEAKLQTREWIERQRAESDRSLDTLNALLRQTIIANKEIQMLAWKQVEAEMIDSLSDPDAAFNFIQKIRDSAALRVLDGERIDKQADEWATVVQAAVEKSVRTRIEKALDNITLGSNAYQKLEQSLQTYIDGVRVGQKEGIDARTFVIDVLRSVAEKNKAAPQGRARNILIQRLIHKLSATETGQDTEESAADPELVQQIKKATETVASRVAASAKPAEKTPAPEKPEVTSSPAPSNTEQAEVGINELLFQIRNFSDADKLGGLPRVMELLHDHADVQDSVMATAEFQTICLKILDGSWYNGREEDANRDISVRYFTELMRDFPQGTYDSIIDSDEYLRAVVKELAITDTVPGETRRAADLFGILGVESYPVHVREMLVHDEQFLDMAVESLVITKHNWDPGLMALCLTDIPRDFREAVFTRPKFVQIFSDFLGGSYRINRDDESIEDTIKRLTPIVGETVMNTDQVKAAIAKARTTEAPEVVIEPPQPRERKSRRAANTDVIDVVATPVESKPEAVPRPALMPSSENTAAAETASAPARKEKKAETSKRKAKAPARRRTENPVVSPMSEFGSLDEMASALPREEEQRQTEFAENMGTEFRTLTGNIDEFLESMKNSGFTVTVDRKTLDSLNAGSFDPDTARDAIYDLGRSLTRQFVTAGSNNEEQLARFQNAIEEIEKLEGRFAAVRKNISSNRPDTRNKVVYEELSDELLNTLRILRQRRNGLSEARQSLARFLRK